MSPPDRKSLPPTGGKEIKINHDILKDIAKKLEADLMELKRLRYDDKIVDDTPPEAAMGNYTAGRGLYNTVSAARTQIGGTYEAFLTAYQGVIEAIRASEKNHGKADDASKRGIENAGGGPRAI